MCVQDELTQTGTQKQTDSAKVKVNKLNSSDEKLGSHVKYLPEFGLASV